jgi:Skp family chaperone for outer membrane proteins
MKTRTVVLGGLILVVVLFMGYGFSFAASDAGTAGSKIGRVSVRDVFRDCKANASYRDKAIAAQAAKNAELDALQKKIVADEAGLKALVPGSSDYMLQYEALINLQAKFEAMKQFVSQQRVFQDRRWTETLYKEVLRITKDLAKKKGLTMVVGVDEPIFPMTNTDELMMALQTHKVLYSDGCVDLSAEVVVEMDKIAATLKP